MGHRQEELDPRLLSQGWDMDGRAAEVWGNRSLSLGCCAGWVQILQKRQLGMINSDYVCHSLVYHLCLPHGRPGDVAEAFSEHRALCDVQGGRPWHALQFHPYNTSYFSK